jgi:hypothetical protein
MKITIIDDSSKDNYFRGQRFKDQLLNAGLAFALNVDFYPEVLGVKKLLITLSDFRKGPLVDVSQTDLLLIHGNNAHCLGFVGAVNKNPTLPIIIYRGGAALAEKNGHELKFDDETVLLEHPESVWIVQKAVIDLEDIHIFKALEYWAGADKDMSALFTIISGKPKHLRLSLQLLRLAVNPARIRSDLLVDGKISEKNEIVHLISVATREAVEAQLNALLDQPAGSVQYEEGLRELKKTLLPSLTNEHYGIK